MEYSRYFQDLPKPRYPSHANSRDKESLNSSTQAKLEEQLEEQHRQGAAVQPYPVITSPDQLHLCSTAVAEEQQAAAAAGRLRSISLVCVLHNTITLHLTAVWVTVKTLSKYCQSQSFTSRM